MRFFKIYIAYSLIFTLIFLGEISGQGTIKTSCSLQSEILGTEIKYSIYLPPDYSEKNTYPTLFLLHGFRGDETSWVKRTNFQYIIDSLIRIEQLPNVIVVFPDGKNTYFINDYTGKVRYEDFFIEEFIPYLNNNFRIQKGKKHTAIGGLSMGGYGATILAIKHPDLFGTVINLSGAVRTDEQFETLTPVKYQTNYSKIYGDSLFGEARITQHWKNNCPYYLIDSMSADSLRTINWYIDCGNKDFLLPANKALHEFFIDYSIPHNFQIRDGDHSWSYWQEGFLIAIKCWGEYLMSE